MYINSPTVLITGGDGLVGQALREEFSNSYQSVCGWNPVFVTRRDANLCNQLDVAELFSKHNPFAVIHTAASVGGIGLNLAKPVEQFTKNIMMK